MLAAVATVIRNQIRSVDQAFRVGDDEFCVLAPHARPIEARQMANGSSASSRAPRSRKAPGWRSRGISSCPTTADDAARLLEMAQEATYAAKASGRCRSPWRGGTIAYPQMTCIDDARSRPRLQIRGETQKVATSAAEVSLSLATGTPSSGPRHGEHFVQASGQEPQPSSSASAPAPFGAGSARLGYPHPRRTPGNHRQYDLTEVETPAARRCDRPATSPRRSRSPAPRARVSGLRRASWQAFDAFDESAADRQLEESLAIRSVERSVEELLLPALGVAAGRTNHEAEFEHACRWAVGWLHSARRLASPASLPDGVLLLDSGSPLGLEAVYVQALELFLRRAGLRVLLLSANLEPRHFASALRALRPNAVVLCGTEASLDIVGWTPAAHAARRRVRPDLRLPDRATRRGQARHRPTGNMPGEAAERLLAVLAARATPRAASRQL